MAEKKYYWLKFKENFFEQDEIKIVENMPNGKEYIIFLLKLQLKSIKTEGYLKFKDTIPYSEEMLSIITSTNVDIVRSALKVFMGLGMVEKLDDGTLFMTEVQTLIGSEGQSAERVRRFRENQKRALLCNGSETNCNTSEEQSNIDIDIDIDIDIELDKDIESDKDKEIIPYKDIINYLNLLAKTNYRCTSKKTKDLIKARYNEGFTLDNFKKVIDNKVKEWKGTEYEKYLRPETLFGTKFESYLNQKVIKPSLNSNGKPSTFNSSDQRTYDFDSLEKKLLGWDKKEDE